MRKSFLCAFIALVYAVGTAAQGGLKGLVAKRGKLPKLDKGLRADVPDNDAVECTPIRTKYKYAESNCTYLKCDGNIYDLQKCPDGIGVNPAFKVRDTSQYGPCSRPLLECEETLEEKGVVEIDTESCGLDFVFVLDMSKSISDVNKMKIRSFVKRMVTALKLGQAFSLVSGVTFGKETHNILYFSTANTPSKILECVRGMKIKTTMGTSTYLALKEARTVYLSKKYGRRNDTHATVIVVTDGITNPVIMSPETIKEAKLLKDPKSYKSEGTAAPKVFLIEVPNNKDVTNRSETGKSISKAEKKKLEDLMEKEFSAIPSPGKEYRHKLDNFDQLVTIINPILRASCKKL